MTEEESKVATEHLQEVSSDSTVPKTSFGTRLKAHYRKWWWAHLAFFVASTLIIVLCLIYVGYPNIAQDNINDSALEVSSLEFSSPTPNSFHLRQNATIVNKSSYHPNLDAFNATLSLQGGKPYASVEIPKLHATERAISIIDQDVTITNLEEFTRYTAAVLGGEEVKIEVRGRTGLNQITGFNVTSFSIKLTPDPDGANMVGTVLLPNPSVLTIAMGNVTFTNYLPASPFTNNTRIPIGISTLNDLVLVPGDNHVPMRSQINQTLVIGAIAKQYKDGMMPVEIVGNTSVYDGQHLTYFEKALQGLTQKVTLNVGKALQDAGVDASTLAALGGGSPP
ncbi:uncharacterized protein KY384_003025 [Bacidia gigantensis]|uniref:uncharacterized protein n=1 Tax=Bacidia gigantensis TaxID=2732470 RepID=UPI001D03C0C9|nr:uncharacterized protein KY384_003025 [Bacidia gigantensis]KAG8531396.1 hypothetical protein KY384_003025 [Bacidia gigantensis]